MEINEVQDPDYEVVTISNLGFVDPYGNEGVHSLVKCLDILQAFWMMIMTRFQQFTKCLRISVKQMSYCW